MLQSIRDRTQGWIAGIIISLLILSFALWGIHSYVEGAGGNNNVVAKVNGIEITKNQLAVTFDRLRRQIQQQYNNTLPANADAQLRDKALQSLISIQVLKQASLAKNYRVSNRQIDNFLVSLPDFQVNGEFSFARFQQVLAASLFTPNDFLDLINTNLLINQPKLGLVFSSYALPNEVSDVIALVGQERDIEYLVISQDVLSKQAITVSDQQVREYYSQHQNEFKTPEQVSLEYIQLAANDLARAIHPTDDALKNYYNENSSTFVEPRKWQLDEIIVPLTENATSQEVSQANAMLDKVLIAAKSGKDFSVLAKEFTLRKGDDKLRNGVTIDQIPQPLQKAASDLTKLGQTSEPVRTSAGWVVLKVIGIKEEKALPFSTVKDKVRDVIARQQAEEKFAEIKEKLANLTYEHPDTLSTAAKELNLPVNTTAAFTREKGGSDISAQTQIREAAFSNDVLNLQNNSDVLQINPDSVVVVRVKSHIPASVLSLETVHNQIVEKLKQSAIQAQAENLAQDIQGKLQSGMTSEQVGSLHHLQWKKAGLVGRHAGQIDLAILDAAFTMPRPEGKQHAIYAIARIANGFAVIGLKAVKEGSVTNAKEQYQAFADQIQSSQGQLEYELYKNGLIKDAKIETE